MELLEIPEEYIPTIQNIAVAEDDAIDELIESLNNSAPSTSIQKLGLSIYQNSSQLSLNEIVEVLEFIASIFRLSEESETSIDEVISQLIALVKTYDDFINLSENDFASLQKRLTRLADKEGTLKISYKSAEVVYDNEKVFLSSRILTDVRPIFGDNIDNSPIAAGIVHSLKINFGKLDANQEFYVSMDERDLDLLIEQINRAKAKSKVLKDLLNKSNITYLGIDL